MHIHKQQFLILFLRLLYFYLFFIPEHTRTCTHLLTNRNSKLSLHKRMWKSTKYPIISDRVFSRTAWNLCGSLCKRFDERNSQLIKFISNSHDWLKSFFGVIENLCVTFPKKKDAVSIVIDLLKIVFFM